jgi:hypothetical protein
MKIGKLQLHQQEKYTIHHHGPLFKASDQLPNVKHIQDIRQKDNVTKFTIYITRTRVNIPGVTALEWPMQKGIVGLNRLMRPQTSHLAQKY